MPAWWVMYESRGGCSSSLGGAASRTRQAGSPRCFPRANSVPYQGVSRISILSLRLTRVAYAFVRKLTCRLPNGHSLWSASRISLKERHFVNAAVPLSELRAHARAPLGRVSARHQLAGRAKVRVPQLLLSADHSGWLLWRSAACPRTSRLRCAPLCLLFRSPPAG